MMTPYSLRIAAACAALALSNLAAAQTPKTGGDDRLVPAPSAEKAPAAGALNPAKQDGSDRGDNALSQPALEQDPKARLQSDSTFLAESALSGAAELKASKLAATKASDPRVKEYAAGLVRDHQAMDAELRRLAAKQKTPLPDALDAQRQGVLDRLAKLDGAAFDKAYIEQMANDHQEAIAFFERRAKDTHDAEVKAFIASSLPALRRHGEKAKSLYALADGGRR